MGETKMATITFSRSFSFQDEPLWTGELSQAGNNTFTISDATHSLTFTGVFTYPGGAPTGTLQNLTYRDSTGVVYTLTGVGREVATVAQAALSTGFTQAIYALMLDGNDTLRGSAGDDSLQGFAGNDLLDGRAGADVMAGGTGDDTYVVDNAGDVVSELADEGIDQVNVALATVGGTYTLGDNIENARLNNSVAFNLTGNDLNNTLVGNAAANRLDGGLGADNLQGGAGDDTYVVDDAGDVVIDSAGTDTVESSISYTLGAGLENLILTGSDAIDGTGNAGANVIDGSQNSAANVLTGLAGNDTYIIGAGDSVVEAAGGGTDLVRSTVDYRLEDNVENLTLIGTDDLEGKGNDLANVITGNSGDNKLDGVGGVDTLIGGLGDDQYVVDLTASNQLEDSIVELAGEGNDTLTLASAFDNALVTTLVLAANLENVDARDTGTLSLNLTGNAADNDMRGNDGNNTLNGLAGADRMRGEDGDDTYVVDNAGDDVIENSGEGNDTANVAIATAGGSYTLTDNVENGRLTNTVAFNLTGNDLANTLVGNAAANRIDGGEGADDMQGGAGDDTYVVDDLGDQVTDTAGIDTVESSVSYTLGAGLENLVLTGNAAISGTGNAAANTLDGSQNSAANVLSGLAGNDTYIVGANDTVVEALNGGTDTVRSAFDHTLADNVENLTLTGSANLDGTGNALANIIIGNSGNNALDGGDGVDTLQGGAGNDDYTVELGANNTLVDRIVEAANEGIDFVILRGGNAAVTTAATITLGANLEGLDASETGAVLLNLTGNAADNLIFGNDADNLINGGAGADLMLGGQGNDTYVVDNDGDDIIELADEGDDTVNVNIATAGGLYALGDNIEHARLINTVAFNLTGNDLDNQLIGNAAANRIDGGLGADDMQGGAGNDTYVVDNAGDLVTDSAGVDTVESSISYTLGAGLENLTLTGSDAINGTGNAAANVLDGSLNTAANVLTGLAGNDTYIVSDGDTVVEAEGGGTDTVRSNVSFTLGDNVENLTLVGSASVSGTGNALANVIIGNSGDNELDGGDGVDTLQGGAGDDTYWLDLNQSNAIIDRVVENAGEGNDLLLLRGGNPALASTVTLTLQANVENIDAAGAAGVKLNLTGNAAANFLGGNDTDNLLNGGAGADTLVGREGNDTYVVDNEGDEVVEQAGEGDDRVNVSIATAGGLYVLGANLENARLTNTVAFDLTGNELDNQLIGNAAANRIDGGLGADDMQGGAGNDTYVVDNVDDLVTDTAGIDTVESSITYVLASTLENLTLTGSDAIDGTGNASANILDGSRNSAANVLTGLAGNDTYIVGDGDTVVEALNGGTDTVQSAQSYTLGDNLENLTLTGTDNIDGTGNGLANIIIGNSANNVLDGGDGVDTLRGGAGDDTYLLDLSQANTVIDTVVENANEGFDTLVLRGGNSALTSTVAIALAANLEALDASGASGVRLNLTGNAADNVLIGNDTDNLINGGAGADFMSGREGNDTYTVDNAGDEVEELDGQGTDTVNVAIATAGGLYTLGDNVENGRLTNTVAFDLSGNAQANQLIGNAAANRLDGGLGADDMQGGAGNDTYVVDDIGDLVTDTAGVDTVESSISYTLGTGLENLVLTGSNAINGTGNAAANILDGSHNTAANVLTGLAGNDTYIIGAGDSVVEAEGGGTDTVQSQVTYQLEANLENLTLLGTANIDGKGNNLANVITGNSGNNKLDGVGGVDTLQGGLGNDQYVVDLTASNQLEDRVIERAGEGIDTLTLTSVFVNSTVTTLVLDANLENVDARDTGTLSLNLTGNAANNIIQGNDGNNTLNGLAGADTMSGHAGNDTYVVDNAGDVVIEQAGEGTDTVNVGIAVAGGLYVLGANVENARLTSTVAFDLTGNADNNQLIGNAAANRLDGGLGADDMQGGAGNDTYVVDNAGDLVTDTAGVDTVESSISYTLGTGLENLVLTGAGVINGTGNAAANTLDGSRNSAANVLTGLAGNDLYILGAGDTVVEALNGGTDTVQTAFDHTLADNVENLTLTGTDDIDGTGNGLANVIIGNSGDNVLNGLGGVDTLRGGAGNDTYVVDLTNTNALQDTVTENANEGTDTLRLNGGSSAAALATIVLAANLENLDASLTGSVLLNLTGNAANNLITGNDADNVLNGGAGNDTLFGGLGNDTLIGGTGNDQMSGGQGNDTYTVDSLGDSVIEGNNAGIDLVNVAIATAGGTYTLGSNVENATLTSTVAYNLTGNELDNTLTGNAAANVLDGGAGADVMNGGAGNDTYYVDDVGDLIIDSAGIDTVISSITFDLDGTSLENITLAGTDDIDAFGNQLANHLIGNSGNNVLDGFAGVDILEGGAGDDLYFVDLTAGNALQDTVIEQAGQGNDVIVAFGGTAGLAATTLTLGANIENLDVSQTEEGVKLNLVGNALDNILVGNSSQNVFTGGLGSDTFAFDALSQLGNTTATRDTITDFVSGVDQIDLTGIGNFTLVANAAAVNGANQVYLDAGVLHGTVDGVNQAFEIVLTGVTTLAQSDFVA